MDREKVINGLRCIKGDLILCVDCAYSDGNGHGTYSCKAFCANDAIALLKEQEAVSPYQFEDIWKCGNCGDGIVAYEELGVSGIEEVKFNYCPTCGRRVLWEGR